MFLPANLETCSIAERNRRLARRHAPVTVVRAEQKLEPAFSHERYAHLLRPPEGASLSATSSERETVAIRLVLPLAEPRDSVHPPTTRLSTAKSSLVAGYTHTAEGGANGASKQPPMDRTSSKGNSSQTFSRSVRGAKPPPARLWWQSSADSITRALPFGTSKPDTSSTSSSKVPPKLK